MDLFCDATAQSLLTLHLCCRRSNAQLDAVAWYLHSMGSTHVLSRSEEVQLGAIIFLGKAITAAQVRATLSADSSA